MMLIGEQRGDMEDRNGVPFIGPAGRLLRNAMEASGIDAERVYLTNAVKHFRWKATAKAIAASTRSRRPETSPRAGRGLPLSWPGTFGVETDAQLFATVRPSAILRAPDRKEAGLVRDLQVAAAALSR